MGCSSKQSTATGAAQSENAPSRPAISPEALESVKKSKVSCSDNECSPSVGMLVILKAGNSAASCSGFLIAKDVLVTNAHCLPAELKKSGSCNDQITVVFPALAESQAQMAGGFKRAEAKCESILGVSSADDKQGTDYAFLKISHLSGKPFAARPFFTFSHAGLEDKQVFRIPSILQTQNKDEQGKVLDSFTGELTTKKCESFQNTAALPGFTAKDSPLLALEEQTNPATGDNCNLTTGNSGSPIVTANNEVLGILQGFADPNHRLKIALEEKGMLFTDTNVKAVFLGTNLACVKSPLDTDKNFVASENCTKPTTSGIPQDADMLYKEIPADILNSFHHESRTLVTDWVKSSVAQKELGYEFVWEDRIVSTPESVIPGIQKPDGLDRYIIPVPSCFHSTGMWSKNENYRDKTKPGSTKLTEKATLTQIIPIFKGRFGYSSELLISERINKMSTVDTQIDFDPAQVLRTGQSWVNMTVNGQRVLSRKVSLCNMPKQLPNGMLSPKVKSAQTAPVMAPPSPGKKTSVGQPAAASNAATHPEKNLDQRLSFGDGEDEDDSFTN